MRARGEGEGKRRRESRTRENEQIKKETTHQSDNVNFNTACDTTLSLGVDTFGWVDVHFMTLGMSEGS